MLQKWIIVIIGFSLITSSLLLISSCHKDDTLEPKLEIYSFSPGSGLIGRHVTLRGNNFILPVPSEEGAGPHLNTSIVKFNGTEAEAEFVYQDSINMQRINVVVPEGATTGPITVTAMGQTATSSEDFVITFPDYIPNVTVSTAHSYGGIDLDIDADGNLYVAENHLREIVKIRPDGSLITVWSWDSIGPEIPRGITVDKDGNVYATVDNSIIKIGKDGMVTTLAGSSNSGYADGSGENAKFYFPFGLTVDSVGNVYVADLLNYKIRKISPSGVVITIAGSTQFEGPIDVALDKEGELLVADGNNIRKITPDGFVSTVAGTTQGFLDGAINMAQFGSIRGLIVDPSGNIFLCDSDNSSVRKISFDGTVSTVAGSTFGCTDGPGHLAKFSLTKGLTMDSDGALYLTTGGGAEKVRKIVID